jgi:hypothetical protein
MSRFFSFGLPLVAAACLCSCGASPKPLTSTPPAKALKASEFTWGDGVLMKKFTFPAGTYLPEAEDSKGYYFAPQNAQVKVFDTGLRYGTKGGIYWKKNLQQPDSVYAAGNFGVMAILSKKDLPAIPLR